jgi:hypothetical protein
MEIGHTNLKIDKEFNLRFVYLNPPERELLDLIKNEKMAFKQEENKEMVSQDYKLKKVKEYLEKVKKKEKRIEKYKTSKGKIKKIASKFNAPSISEKITYKKGNPMKSLLKSKGKRPTIKVHGGEQINLMRSTW